MNSIPGTPEDRLDADIERVDEIVLEAADILYELEKDLASGVFNVEDFESRIGETFDLDPSRKLLFQRASQRYREAIQYTQGGDDVLKGFLESTKLNLPAYQKIRAMIDPRRPGVIVIHLKDGKDAAQFNADTESDFNKKLKTWGADQGVPVTVSGDERGFIGKSMDLESMGLPETLPILGVIVVCDEVGDQTEKEGVTNHEYAHAVYKGLLQPFLHKYLSGAQFKKEEDFTQWTTRFTKERRKKLFEALGDFSTKKSEQLDESIKNPPPALPKSRRSLTELLTIQGIPVRTITHEEQLEREIYDVLFEEQYILNELRAYGFSHATVDPLPGLTHLKIRPLRDKWNTNEPGVMDLKMVQRYFQVHMLTVRSYFQSPELHLKALSILGTAQTLDQATRLIRALIEKSAWSLPSKENFDELCRIIAVLQESKAPPLYAIDRESGEALIPNQELVASLLPPREIFEAALAQYYPVEKSTDAADVERLYGLS